MNFTSLLNALPGSVAQGVIWGVLAIGVHQIGMLGKLFTEEMERMDETPVEACHAVGANGVQTMFYARLPQLMPIYASLVLNHFEIAVRSASTLGLVGAGGIGSFAINYGQNQNHPDIVNVCVVVLLVIVFILQSLGNALARRTTNRGLFRKVRKG